MFSVASRRVQATAAAFARHAAPLAVPTRRAALRPLSTANPFTPTDQFLTRHIGPSEEHTEQMLATCGFRSMDEMLESTIPAKIRMDRTIDIGEPQGEQETLAQLKTMMSKNQALKSFIGQGYYGTHVPTVILRNILENPGWYTSYTPYQAEIAQGRLESLLNYQTMVADLTGTEYSNASLLDEATAAAEAMFMCYRIHRGKRTKFFVADTVHPQSIGLIQTRAEPLDVEVVIGSPDDADFSGADFAGAIVQYPDTFGAVQDYESFAARAAANGTRVVAATDLLALTVLRPPGEWGADICVGSAQRFGVPMGFGGPHAGFLSVANEKLLRVMPGRIIGMSKDSSGRPALRMALQTREQHIRRDKATSNICTAQALLANMAASYAVYHGPEGLKAIANRTHRIARVVAAGAKSAGHDVRSDAFFDTVAIALNGTTADAVMEAAVARGINLRRIDDATVGVACDETTTQEDVQALLEVFGATAGVDDLVAATASAPQLGGLDRTSDFLTNPVFNSHHSETQMLRYLAKLQSRDLSLSYGMIPLGSCTMKLNATSEMIPVTWNEVANIHPFAPAQQVQGYADLIDDLSADLCDITGFAAMSMQPNSGANGEYAGLMAIRSYLASKGEGHRNVCLCPASAHGTNPASAAMAGMKVVVVKNTAAGDIDLEDLKAKATKHKDNLAAIMITYPSTYGVFEEGVVEINKLVHEYGGQVYMDGANMNAQVGFTSPGDLGADVCHLNLHKTFCIPHGGGGPGVGSIGVAEHLAPHLPGHNVIATAGNGRNVTPKTTGAVAAAPEGSAAILPITWMYIKMLGTSGLERATAQAILNANYMAKRLEGAYDIAFTGVNGQCAHEFILDLNPIKKAAKDIGADLGEEDIAKRLIDYGFHAPTMSWPVAGTLMVEPTESEDKRELDRFCDAMIAIRKEVDDVLNGVYPADNNPLVNAPHTARAIATEEWDRPYSRDVAVYPSAEVRHHKFWPHVGRVDNVWGDRNLVCSCPPVESYMDSDDE